MSNVGKVVRRFDDIKDDMVDCAESIDGSEASTI